MKNRNLVTTALVAVIGVGIGSGSAVIFAKPMPKQTARPAAKSVVSVSTKFAALAVDRNKGFVYGFSFDQPSRAAATAVAMQECAKRKGNCGVVVEVTGPGCVAFRAVSADKGTAYGWGTSPTQTGAEQRATLECDNYAGKPGLCSNNVWACNSAEPAAFKVLRSDPVRRDKSPKDCLIQYKLDLYDGGNNWKSRFYSPVYRLATADCPIVGNGIYDGFYHKIWDDSGQTEFGQVTSPPPKGSPAQKEKGFGMAKDFFNWTVSRRLPMAGLKLKRSVGFSSSTPTETNIRQLVENAGGHDPGDYGRVADGLCIGFAPPGVAPLEVLGAERCKRWVR